MRLLLAEDNDMNVDLFTAALEHDEVTVARDGAKALELALKQNFDLILLDIQMPRMSGHQVCRALRQAGIDAPIVALTASAMADEVQMGRASGFDAYLTKPISPEGLRAAVRQYARSAL